MSIDDQKTSEIVMPPVLPPEAEDDALPATAEAVSAEMAEITPSAAEGTDMVMEMPLPPVLPPEAEDDALPVTAEAVSAEMAETAPTAAEGTDMVMEMPLPPVLPPEAQDDVLPVTAEAVSAEVAETAPTATEGTDMVMEMPLPPVLPPEAQDDVLPVTAEAVSAEVAETAPTATEGTKIVDLNIPPHEQMVAAPPKDKTLSASLITEIDKNNKNVSADENADTPQQASSDINPKTKKQKKNEKPAYTSPEFLKELFANGNECITAPGGSYIISDTTRSMLALFSNGRYFVAESHKYDGPPLLFATDTKRRRLQIGQAEYVPMVVINSIYEYAAKIKAKSSIEADEGTQEQARMQRDFITIVTKAAASHVSDIHIIVADHTTVMFRLNGLMQGVLEYNKEWGESFVRAAFALADISDANYAQNEYQAAQKVGKTALRGSGGRLVLPRNVQGIRLQFNPIAFGTRYVVMRLLYDEENAESAGDLSVLGFEPQEEEIFYRLRAVPTGIVIVAGPTGSGKSTTLQRNMISMLQERNYELNLITVEDPPEYPIPGARQMPVTNAATEELKDREFTKALSASLRSDPDALMIGEIRTLAAADLAFRGALSGHNVWTTLHANSAPSILIRLKDMGVEDFKLQDPTIMKGMLSQRLFRKICPHCRIPAKEKPDNPAVQRLRQAFGDIGVELSYLRGAGCKYCDFRGVRGRTAVGEFVLPDATFLDLMLRGESKKALDYWVTELGGRTLKEAAQARMLKGLIDIEEVERWTGLLNELQEG
ncbi:MAG: ATPase, T2SS/T4P/T4SS family [Alphaproteobacteria bacterium]